MVTSPFPLFSNLPSLLSPRLLHSLKKFYKQVKKKSQPLMWNEYYITFIFVIGQTFLALAFAFFSILAVSALAFLVLISVSSSKYSAWLK
jgi:hypothetical protein